MNVFANCYMHDDALTNLTSEIANRFVYAKINPRNCFFNF